MDWHTAQGVHKICQGFMFHNLFWSGTGQKGNLLNINEEVKEERKKKWLPLLLTKSYFNFYSRSYKQHERFHINDTKCRQSSLNVDMLACKFQRLSAPRLCFINSFSLWYKTKHVMVIARPQNATMSFKTGNTSRAGSALPLSLQSNTASWARAVIRATHAF